MIIFLLTPSQSYIPGTVDMDNNLSLVDAGGIRILKRDALGPMTVEDHSVY